MTLPAGRGSVWGPDTCTKIVGRTTVLEFDGHREDVKIIDATPMSDPAYIEVALEIQERPGDDVDALTLALHALGNM